MKSWLLSLVVGGFTWSALAAEQTFKVGEFTFQRPAKWEATETSSSMRKAQLVVKDANSTTPGEVVFFHFGAGAGGGTKANVDRWFSQFQEPREQLKTKVDEQTVGKTKVTYVQARGTYLSGMPGGPRTQQPDFALHGAILESGEGDVFVRFTGPEKLVQAHRDAFKKMIESGLKKP